MNLFFSLLVSLLSSLFSETSFYEGEYAGYKVEIEETTSWFKESSALVVLRPFDRDSVPLPTTVIGKYEGGECVLITLTSPSYRNSDPFTEDPEFQKALSLLEAAQAALKQ